MRITREYDGVVNVVVIEVIKDPVAIRAVAVPSVLHDISIFQSLLAQVDLQRRL